MKVQLLECLSIHNHFTSLSLKDVNESADFHQRLLASGLTVNLVPG
jgi:hypothetical protein